ncbi:MAG: sigma-70 family RNA polymerase sigma factor [Defluviitaleaceae bacterium]|nr:sigma-70 family RNA polymerase sigma factor [Defluviitaleaceae bacterium]
MDIPMETYTKTDVDLEHIVATYGDAILRYCHLLLGDYHEAQDAVQTTFIKAFYSPAAGRYAPGDMSPILYKIAYNGCMDILRRRKRFFSFLEREKSAASHSYIMPHDENGIGEEVAAALDSLSPKDRALVINRLVDGMDYDTLDRVYGASPAALRKRYERAKKKLADALRAQGLEGR